MKEIILKFETEELYKKFIDEIVIPLQNEDNKELEFNFETNVGIIKDNGNT